ncbi:MAG: acyl carrier protein [Candidatus Eremiobacteraeota bacterium]|jgi:acyl carrier protein|nr:acyl carrier protein [Candidatus Eremiobacteraeota bacterium]
MPVPLLELIASVMEVDASEVTENSDNETLGKWDSMRQIMLATMLESEYGFTLSNDELAGLQSVGKIRTILARHRVEGA